MRLNDQLARLREWWQAQDTKRKIALIFAVAIVIASIVALLQILLRPAYAPLFTQLDTAEAGAIVEELQAMNVPYRLTGQGGTIEVPEDMVYETRIKLASAGVLMGQDKGFELFDQQRFGITDFEQHVGYQRALQGELRRTIEQLEEVEQARVHLVIPEKSVFIENQSSPSASIVLKLKQASQLSPEQIQGIVDIVSGAIEGLEPQDVHIVDTKGNVLNDYLPVQGSGISATVESQISQELKRNFEKEMEDRIQKMLFRIFGPDSVVAMVTAELDFDERQTVSTTHGPGQILSQQEITETQTGGNAGNFLDADGEIYAAEEGNVEGTHNREEIITNYEVDTTQETVIASPGRVERLSVAVVINQSLLGDPQDQEAYDQKIMEVQNIVASAIGFDAARGDQINVSGIPFDTSLEEIFQEEQPEEPESVLDRINPYLAAGIAGGVLIIILVILIFLRRRAKARREDDSWQDSLPLNEPELPEPEPIVPGETDPRESLREMAREQPERVAEILKLWLKE